MSNKDIVPFGMVVGLFLCLVINIKLSNQPRTVARYKLWNAYRNIISTATTF